MAIFIKSIIGLSFLIFSTTAFSQSVPDSSDTEKEWADIIATNLRFEAALRFNLNQLPSTIEEWKTNRTILRSKLLTSAGVKINSDLPLDIRETGTIKMKGYSIKKIYFQTKPGVYATANLYIPDGKGTFPAIINVHGHWQGGKAGEMIQPRGHELALNGYVCLNMDAWGSGERTTIHGKNEYHGSNLGASLLNIGETLLGNQLTDNIRGVDLLCSLPYVDKNRIGATGASGGGNQTMWLAALDERIKAAMPVVSVGTFQSYILGSNCVCEMMPRGLTFTEESGVLALIAPRALNICSSLKEQNPTFLPSEMLRSFTNAKSIYTLYHQEDNIQYRLFDVTHGYWPEIRETMLGWFDWKLRGIGEGHPKKEIPFTLLPPEQLMVFPEDKRSPLVTITSDYCIQRGKDLIQNLYQTKTIDREKKIQALKNLLSYSDSPDKIKQVHELSSKDGWQKLILETTRQHLIPLRVFPPAKGNSHFVVIATDQEKTNNGASFIRDYLQKGYGVVIADLWGIGEFASGQSRKIDGGLPRFHTLARAEMWLGRTIMEEWVNDIKNVIDYIRSNYQAGALTLDATGELALAALIQSALNNNTDTCILRTCPISYALDRREGIDFFDMGIHIPGILNWGDISLMAALNNNTRLIFKNPVTITGDRISDKGRTDFRNQFLILKDICKTQSIISLTE